MLRRPRIALLAALACVAGLGITLVLAYFAPPFGGRDAATLQGFVDLNRPRLTPLRRAASSSILSKSADSG